MAKNIVGKYFVKNKENDTFRDVSTLFNGVAVLKISGLGERGEAINVYTEQWLNEPSQQEDFLITSDDGRIIRKNVDIEMTFAVSRRYALTDTFVSKFGTTSCDAGELTLITTLNDGETITFDKSVEIHFVESYNEESVTTSTTFTATSNGTLYVVESSNTYVTWYVETSIENDDYDEQKAYDFFVDYMTGTDIWIKTLYYNKVVHCCSTDIIAPDTTKLQRNNDSYIIGKITFHTLEKPANV